MFREEFIESAQVVLYELLTSRPANRAVLEHDFRLRLPEGITEDEIEVAVRGLHEKGYVTVERIPLGLRFSRGPRFIKWKPEIYDTTNQGTANRMDKHNGNNPRKERAMETPSIFLCHSSKDKAFVRNLAKSLQGVGIRFWLDEAEIKIGESLTRKIGNAIDQIDFFGAVLSQHSIKSEWVQRELEIAIQRELKERRVIILPLLLEPVELPPFLQDKLYADFTSPDQFDDSFSKLLQAMGMDAQISESTPLNKPLVSVPDSDKTTHFQEDTHKNIESSAALKFELDHILVDLLIALDEAPFLSLNPGPDYLQSIFEQTAANLRKLIRGNLYDDELTGRSLQELSDRCDSLGTILSLRTNMTWHRLEEAVPPLRAFAADLRANLLGGPPFRDNIVEEFKDALREAVPKLRDLLRRSDQMFASARFDDVLYEAAEVGSKLIQYAYQSPEVLELNQQEILAESARNLHLLRYQQALFKGTGSDTRLKIRITGQLERIEQLYASLQTKTVKSDPQYPPFHKPTVLRTKDGNEVSGKCWKCGLWAVAGSQCQNCGAVTDEV